MHNENPLCKARGMKIAVSLSMKILTLFLALFLTLLPESVTFVSLPQGQDVCLEEVDDVEEQAVIRLPKRTPTRVLTPSLSLSTAPHPIPVLEITSHLVHYCFERQWLKACLLRL